MDRNYYANKDCDWVRVALRKESVDRNHDDYNSAQTTLVALRKESVDRNCFGGLYRWLRIKSLSARRAWIEIAAEKSFKAVSNVALRKESVDRNGVDY